ncbi:aspartate 1-decarboxylase [Candidatus Calescamantes bacterium]|nr:aspartate 1-decarboxylase [Candidatus Calescamantes bacterium]
MLRRFLRVKIKGARVTDTQLFYEGSITLDEEIVEKAGLLPGEEVLVLNLNNGERFTTYVIKGEKGSGVVCLNGPAARLGYPGDELIILCFAYLDEEEIKAHSTRFVTLNEQNKVVEVKDI